MSKSLEGIAVGDPHLESYKFLSNYIENPDDMIYRAMDKAVSYAHEHDINYMFVLGDIYDHPDPSQESQKRFLRYIRDTGLQVHCIGGNHDRTSNNEHSLIMAEFLAKEAYDNVFFYTEPTVIELEGVPVCMMPWPATKTLLKGPGVNVAHITLKGAKSDSGRELTKGEEFTLRSDQYWLIGDLHTNQQTKYVHYVGTMAQKNFGESLPKGFSHFNFKVKGAKLRVRDDFIVTKPPFELVNLRIDSIEDVKNIEPYDPNDIKLYKLKMMGDVVLPTTFRQDYPQVYEIDWGKRKRVVEKDGKKISISGIDKPLRGLRSYLIKEGLTKEEAEQGYIYAKQKLKGITV